MSIKKNLNPTKSAPWTFLTNHSHVLLCLAAAPTLTLRDVAQHVGITERAVQRIVSDLEEAQILSHTKEGRNNHYKFDSQKPLRHPVESHRKVADLLKLIR